MARKSGLSGVILTGALILLGPAAAVAETVDRVPVLNIDPTCQGSETTAAGFGRGPDVCRRAELDARDQLVRQWDEFPGPDRRRCVQLGTMSNIPSYVQVLTCLEMAREARTLPDRRSTVGSGR